MDKLQKPQEKKRTFSTVWQHNIKNARNLTAFWFFGLTNNFGYVIMLSAAFDLLAKYDTMDDKETHFARVCNKMSTGAILLANIIPSFFVKIIVPFLPLYMHVRMGITVVTYSIGLIMVALAPNKTSIISGVAFVSFASGLGESSLITYTVLFNTKNVISTWASGTGAAGLIGAFAYSGLIQIGLEPYMTILIMLVMPALMAACFWFLLERPVIEKFTREVSDVDKVDADAYATASLYQEFDQVFNFTDKLKLIPYLIWRYTLFYGLVYFFEYYINQGLFELMQFPNAFLTIPEQYRWYNFCYQLGVFTSRSSMNIVKIHWIWLLAALQGVNVLIFNTEVLYGYFKYLTVAMILIVYEGLLGGAAYVNTFRLIATEMPEHQKEFSMGLNAIGDSIMITFAGFVALPVHNAICNIRSPYNTTEVAT